MSSLCGSPFWRCCSSPWTRMQLWESQWLSWQAGGFLQGRRHRPISTCVCYWHYWWAVQFTFSQGVRTATPFMSPVSFCFIAHKAFTFCFSTTYLLPFFFPISSPSTYSLPTLPSPAQPQCGLWTSGICDVILNEPSHGAFWALVLFSCCFL